MFLHKVLLIEKELFLKLRDSYSNFSSFAVWRSWEDVADLSVFEDPPIIEQLNNDFVFVAINPAVHNETRNADKSLDFL